MSRYGDWDTLGSLEGATASGRLAGQLTIRHPLTASLSESAKRDAAVAELLAMGSGERFNPMAYGAPFDGVNDDSPGLQAAETARAAVNGIMELPPGRTGVLNSQVTIGGDYIDWRGGLGTVLVANFATAPALRFGGAAAVKWLYISGLNVKAGVAAHRIPLVQVGGAGYSVSRFLMERIKLDFDSLARDGLQMIDAFNGELLFGDAFNCSAAGPVWQAQAATQTSGNIHFQSVSCRDAAIGFLLNEYVSGSNVLNSIQMSNCKCVRASGESANVFAACTVAAGGAAAGQSVINLTAGQGASSGIAAGHWVMVTNGSTDTWVDKVLSVSTDAVTLTATLPFALSAGHQVILGNWHTVAGKDTRGILMNVPHFEKINGLLGSGVRTVRMLCPVNDSANGVYRDAYAARGCQAWDVVQPFANANWATTGVVFESPASFSNVRMRVTGPCQFATAGQPASITSGVVSFVGRGGGIDERIGPFYQNTTVSASQTAVQLLGPTGIATGVLIRKPGYLYGLTVHLATDWSAGNLTVTAYINGSVSATVTALISTAVHNNNTLELELDTALIALATGDIVDFRVTTDGSWAPTANTLVVYGLVTQ